MLGTAVRSWSPSIRYLICGTRTRLHLVRQPARLADVQAALPHSPSPRWTCGPAACGLVTASPFSRCAARPARAPSRRRAEGGQREEALRRTGRLLATRAALSLSAKTRDILPVPLDQLLAMGTVVPTTRNLARRDPRLLITRRASFLLQQICEHPATSNLEGSAVAAPPPAIIIS